MAADPKLQIEKALRSALREEAPAFADMPIVLERPKQAGHGDFSSNVALQIAKALKKNPRELANALASKTPLDGDFMEKPEVAGPGFINFRLKAGTKSGVVRRVLEEAGNYGRTRSAQAQKMQVEFVSANPTGPLHVGHGRQAALGDAIAALLEAQGHAVTREFYYNDAGAQIEKLALSVQARARGIRPGEPGWPQEGYNGEYIEDIAREVRDRDDLDAIRRHAVAYLRREQDADLQAFGVKFDVYYLESSLYAEGRVEEVVRAWTEAARFAIWLPASL